jgi:isochorismate hydrolase
MSRPWIPTVYTYVMPRPDKLPTNVASWSVVPSRAALLIHDMQEFFLRGFPDTASPLGALVANCVRLRTACRAAGVPVAYTAQPGAMTPTQRGLLNAIWGPGMSADAVDRVIIPQLSPGADERVFTKWRYSAFHASDLGEWLVENDRDQLIICGVYAHIGILATVIDSFSRDIETFLPSDGVADFSPEYHMLALDYAARNCAVVLPTEHITAALDSPRRVRPDAQPVMTDSGSRRSGAQRLPSQRLR